MRLSIGGYDYRRTARFRQSIPLACLATLKLRLTQLKKIVMWLVR